jgi:hypothetical protein
MAAIYVAVPASAQQSHQQKQQEIEKRQEIERLGAKFLLRQEIQSLDVKYGDYFDKGTMEHP